MTPFTGIRGFSRVRAPSYDLFMNLIHARELNGANPFDYPTRVAAPDGVAAKLSGVDAVELPRDAGPARHTRCCVIMMTR